LITPLASSLILFYDYGRPQFDWKKALLPIRIVRVPLEQEEIEEDLPTIAEKLNIKMASAVVIPDTEENLAILADKYRAFANKYGVRLEWSIIELSEEEVSELQGKVRRIVVFYGDLKFPPRAGGLPNMAIEPILAYFVVEDEEVTPELIHQLRDEVVSAGMQPKYWVILNGTRAAEKFIDSRTEQYTQHVNTCMSCMGHQINRRCDLCPLHYIRSHVVGLQEEQRKFILRDFWEVSNDEDDGLAGTGVLR
jgi:hypothetical protein